MKKTLTVLAAAAALAMAAVATAEAKTNITIDFGLGLGSAYDGGHGYRGHNIYADYEEDCGWEWRRIVKYKHGHRIVKTRKVYVCDSY
jgi:uncharacterized protein (DUF2141 family)